MRYCISPHDERPQMTENIDPIFKYKHADAMRLRAAVIKNCGETYDPIFLLCSYLQHACDKKQFATIIELMEMSEVELAKIIDIK